MKAVELGLIREEKYDPERRHKCIEFDGEPGDTIYIINEEYKESSDDGRSLESEIRDILQNVAHPPDRIKARL